MNFYCHANQPYTCNHLTFEIMFSFRNHIKSLWFDIQNTASSQLYGILNNDYFNGCKNNFVGYLLTCFITELIILLFFIKNIINYDILNGEYFQCEKSAKKWNEINLLIFLFAFNTQKQQKCWFYVLNEYCCPSHIYWPPPFVSVFMIRFSQDTSQSWKKVS